jgi:LacI family transcriptional regulator
VTQLSTNENSSMQKPRKPGRRGPARVNAANIRDVAARAGVSPATVSRVISDTANVSLSTKKRVEDAMAELNYVVNGLAQSMTGRGNRSVAFFVDQMIGPTFADIARGVEEVSSDAGHIFSIMTTQHDADREMELLKRMREQRAAAVIMVGASSMTEEYCKKMKRYVEYLSAVDVKLIVCARPEVPGLPGIPSAHYDNQGGTAAITEHLIGLGHRKILFVGGVNDHSTSHDRLAGYLQALTKHGIAIDERLILEQGFDLQDGEAAINSALEASLSFTAAVCVRDAVAIGALRAIKAAGLKVPLDISVTGYDDEPFMGDLSPGLTTVRIPFHDLGVAAANLALNDPKEKHIVLPVEVVVRGSTAPPRN